MDANLWLELVQIHVIGSLRQRTVYQEHWRNQTAGYVLSMLNGFSFQEAIAWKSPGSSTTTLAFRKR